MNELSIKELQQAIKLIKDSFEDDLANSLNLTRVSAPLFVTVESGLNDHLSGSEKPVTFKLDNYPVELEIVQSLAKWKRQALKDYEFDLYEGLYADMNAIRPSEILDNTHSIYVDQWDWEVMIKEEDRNLNFLTKIVNKIYNAFLEVQSKISEKYPNRYAKKLPNNITFISTQELEDMYPSLCMEERENAIARKHKAVFIYGIGHHLKSGLVHGTRSFDYDDWNLNGDIIFYNPVSDKALELSSMGIRVNADILEQQMYLKGLKHNDLRKYHHDVLSNKLPFTIGGGIGQSRICMFFLEKAHIGGVQASYWSDDVIEAARNNKIKLL